MIFDRIENINRYGLDLEFVKEDLKKGVFKKGKYDINDSDNFGIGLEYYTKDSREALWEAHRKYLDIHILLKGEEYIYISQIDEMTSTKEYEDDYELFIGVKQHRILMTPGYFLILFPNEVHQTSVKVNESLLVKKNVYKLLL